MYDSRDWMDNERAISYYFPIEKRDVLEKQERDEEYRRLFPKNTN